MPSQQFRKTRRKRLQKHTYKNTLALFHRFGGACNNLFVRCQLIFGDAEVRMDRNKPRAAASRHLLNLKCFASSEVTKVICSFSSSFCFRMLLLRKCNSLLIMLWPILEITLWLRISRFQSLTSLWVQLQNQRHGSQSNQPKTHLICQRSCPWCTHKFTWFILIPIFF